MADSIEVLIDACEAVVSEKKDLINSKSSLSDEVENLTRVSSEAKKTLEDLNDQVTKMGEKVREERKSQIEALENRERSAAHLFAEAESKNQQAQVLINENVNLKSDMEKKMAELDQKQSELDRAIATHTEITHRMEVVLEASKHGICG